MQRDHSNESEAIREPKLVRVSDAARELTLSIRMTWRLIAEGQLKVVRFGRAVRVTRASLDDLVAQGGTRR